MTVTKETVTQALRHVQHPTRSADLITADAVRRIAVCDGYVSVAVDVSGLTQDQRADLARSAADAIRSRAAESPEQIADVHVEFVGAPSSTPPPKQPAADRSSKGKPPDQQNPQSQAQPMPGVKHVIAVGAGKGGVGKSTVAVNLAVGLARKGHAVGLMDGDIYGPSIPTMLGLGSLETAVHEGRIQPFLVHGVKAATIGKLVDPERPLVWRGPMAHGAFKQLIEQTNWAELDYLVIDLPPGTGDVPLTMAQLLRLTGAVIVCTPQKVAQDDAVRAARMFQQLGVDVIGVIENMSYFVGDDGKEYDIFGRGGAQTMAQRLGVPFLGAVPITMALRENSDSGDPTANFEPPTDDPRATLARELENLVERLEEQTALAAARIAGRTPKLTIN